MKKVISLCAAALMLSTVNLALAADSKKAPAVVEMGHSATKTPSPTLDAIRQKADIAPWPGRSRFRGQSRCIRN